MDGTFDLDIDALRESVNTAEHILIRFTPIAERLLLDFRTNDTTGPGVAVLSQVTSFAERLATIERARPGFPKPDRLYVVAWPLRIASLERLDILRGARVRLAEMSAPAAIRQLDEAYEELLRLERKELSRAITGDGYHTIWPTVRQS